MRGGAARRRMHLLVAGALCCAPRSGAVGLHAASRSAYWPRPLFFFLAQVAKYSGRKFSLTGLVTTQKHKDARLGKSAGPHPARFLGLPSSAAMPAVETTASAAFHAADVVWARPPCPLTLQPRARQWRRSCGSSCSRARRQ